MLHLFSYILNSVQSFFQRCFFRDILRDWVCTFCSTLPELQSAGRLPGGPWRFRPPGSKTYRTYIMWIFISHIKHWTCHCSFGFEAGVNIYLRFTWRLDYAWEAISLMINQSIDSKYKLFRPHWKLINGLGQSIRFFHLISYFCQLHLHCAALLLCLQHLPRKIILGLEKQDCLYPSSCSRPYLYLCIYICAFIFVYLHLCIFICVFAFVFVWNTGWFISLYLLPVSFLLCRVVFLPQKHHFAASFQSSLGFVNLVAIGPIMA